MALCTVFIVEEVMDRSYKRLHYDDDDDDDDDDDNDDDNIV